MGSALTCLQHDYHGATLTSDQQLATEKQDILRQISFGERIAEEEIEELAGYFVETDQWKRIFRGDVDVVYGAKGSGKSAIYSLLMTRTNELFDRGILIVAGENPRGAPAFKDLVTDPPASEHEFVALWKLYLLCLIAEALREYGIAGADAVELIEPLEEAGPDPKGKAPLAPSSAEGCARVRAPNPGSRSRSRWLYLRPGHGTTERADGSDHPPGAHSSRGSKGIGLRGCSLPTRGRSVGRCRAPTLARS